MNTMIGKSTGIALLLAAAMLAALFAMGVFSATSVFAALPAPAANDVVIGAPNSGGYVKVTITLTNDGTKISKNDDIVINLGSITTLDLSDASVQKADVSAKIGSTTKTVNSTSFADKKLTLTLDDDVGPGVKVEITIAESAKVKKADPNADKVCDDDVLSSCEPGAAVKVTVDSDDLPGVDAGLDFTLNMGGLVIPEVIGEERILIQSAITDPVSFSGNPSDVEINGSKITLSIPSTKQDGSGASGDLTVGKYTVTFKQSAGITNPAAAGDVTITVGVNTVATGTVQRVIKLSKTSGTRGTETTATLKGFSNGTATVYLNGDTPDEKLGEVTIADNVGTLEIDTTSSKFEANRGGGNKITATDSSGMEQDVSAKFTISPKVVVDPEETSVSKSVTVKLSDWPAGAITKVELAGILYTFNKGFPTIDKTGKREFTLNVDSDANRGTQTLKVTQGEVSATASLKIGVLSLDIQPSTAVPGQEITIQASGFVFEDEIKVVQIGNQTAKVNATANSGGNIVITLKIPSPDTTGAIAIGDGTKTVTVKTIDGYSGRIAEGSIEIPEAAITLSPDNSRRGTTVNASGTGFPSGDLVQVQYDNNGVSVTVAAGSADASGAVSIDFVVPSYARIGTKHDVKAASVGIYKGVTAEATHTTPDAVLTLEPQQAVSGTNMTISGMNFPAFATVSVMKIGTIDVRPVPAPSTSVDGDFESTVLVPQLEIGNQTVTITVSSTNITTFLEIVTETAVAVTDPAELFAELGARLLRVWEFDNDSQTWSFYDPRPDFEDFNSLTEVSSGDIATIIISSGAPIAFQGTNLYPGGTSVVVLK